jgi:hypothetical protein
VRSARLAAVAACSWLWVVPAAGAFDFPVEEWEASWAGFEDDFSDDVLPDGGADEPLYYLATCGAIGDDDESGGVLRLRGPQEPCGGVTGGHSFGLSEGMRVEAGFVWELPPSGQIFGISLVNAAEEDIASVAVVRDQILGIGSDALIVLLSAEPTAPSAQGTPVRLDVVSSDVPSDESQLASLVRLELRLEVAPGAGDRLDPTASYRLCASDPCPDEGTLPFTTLATPAIPGPPADVPPLDARENHFAGFFAYGTEDFTIELDDLRVGGDPVADDFEDGAFVARPPYVSPCGTPGEDFREQDGRLHVSGPVEACGAPFTGFAGSLAGEMTVRATFPFSVQPLPCQAYGLLVGSVSEEFALEFVGLEVWRMPTQGPDHDDALVVVAFSEPFVDETLGTVLLPTFARSILAEDAASAALDAASIELELSLVGDIGALEPQAAYRLCDTPTCPDPAVEPFVALTPLSEPPPRPGDRFCGLFGFDVTPPPDGGRIDSPEPAGALLTALPEPGGALASAAALATLGVLVRRRAR